MYLLLRKKEECRKRKREKTLLIDKHRDIEEVDGRYKKTEHENEKE